jgi:ribosome maturation factor RimP
MDQPVDGRKRFRGVLLGVRDAAVGIRLADKAEAGEAWLPLDEIGDAKLVLTDVLIKAAPPPRLALNEVESNGA